MGGVIKDVPLVTIPPALGIPDETRKSELTKALRKENGLEGMGELGADQER